MANAPIAHMKKATAQAVAFFMVRADGGPARGQRGDPDNRVHGAYFAALAGVAGPVAVAPPLVDGFVVLLLSGTVPAVLPGVPVAPAVPVVPVDAAEPMEPDDIVELLEPIAPEAAVSGIVAVEDVLPDDAGGVASVAAGAVTGGVVADGVVDVSSTFLPQAASETTAARATAASAVECSLDVFM